MAGRPGGLALCHEWLGARRGSEKTFEAMAGAFPDADLYALTWDRSAGLAFGGREVRTTFLDRLGPLRSRRVVQLPLMPVAWRYASRRRYDVVVTSSHACAKGFWPAREALHLCYCYTPMRYVWLSSVDQRRRTSRVGDRAQRVMRAWDLASVGWVDEFAAISTAVARRIQELYGRKSQVIHPPVDTDHFTPGDEAAREGFVLAVSRFIPYKALDVAIRAAHQARRPLVVAGTGPGETQLRALAARLGADVRFVVAPDDGRLRDLYRAAGVVLFPAEEDFGIVPVEAQACGTPVVALDRGGTVDTVIPGVTGVLVPGQDEDQLAAAVETVLGGRFDPAACRRSAERFSARVFEERFVDWVVGAAAARGIAIDDPRRRERV